jgi:hypothetical protein
MFKQMVYKTIPSLNGFLAGSSIAGTVWLSGVAIGHLSSERGVPLQDATQTKQDAVEQYKEVVMGWWSSQ